MFDEACFLGDRMIAHPRNTFAGQGKSTNVCHAVLYRLARALEKVKKCL